MASGRSLATVWYWLGALGFIIAMAPATSGSAMANESTNALLSAIVQRSFEPGSVDAGYRWLATRVAKALPDEPVNDRIAAAAVATFQGPRPSFRDVTATYRIFETRNWAETFFAKQLMLMSGANAMPGVVTEFTISAPNGATMLNHCRLSAVGEAIDCLYLDPNLSVVIELRAGPSPRLDSHTTRQGLIDAFRAGEGAIAVTSVMPAARAHLRRAAGL